MRIRERVEKQILDEEFGKWAPWRQLDYTYKQEHVGKRGCIPGVDHGIKELCKTPFDQLLWRVLTK
jgi:hypothetical protein